MGEALIEPCAEFKHVQILLSPKFMVTSISVVTLMLPVSLLLLCQHIWEPQSLCLGSQLLKHRSPMEGNADSQAMAANLHALVDMGRYAMSTVQGNCL